MEEGRKMRRDQRAEEESRNGRENNKRVTENKMYNCCETSNSKLSYKQ